MDRDFRRYSFRHGHLLGSKIKSKSSPGKKERHKAAEYRFLGVVSEHLWQVVSGGRQKTASAAEYHFLDVVLKHPGQGGEGGGERRVGGRKWTFLNRLENPPILIPLGKKNRGRNNFRTFLRLFGFSSSLLC